MKKNVLALTTALSMFALAPANAEEVTGVDPDCMMTNADGAKVVDKTKCPDGKTMSSAVQDNMTSGGNATPADEANAPGMEPDATQKNDQQTSTTDGGARAADDATAQAPAGETMAPADDIQTSTTEPATDSTDNGMASTTAGSTIIVPAEVMSGTKVMSASDYIGKRVYDRAGNDIGEVNDLIISEDGKVQATILGVGGFLGLGEKDVAVEVSSVQMVDDGNGVKLVVDTTKEQLESAPAFDAATRNYAG